MSLGHALDPHATLNTPRDMMMRIVFLFSTFYGRLQYMLTLIMNIVSGRLYDLLLGDRCRWVVRGGSHVGGLQPYLAYST